MLRLELGGLSEKHALRINYELRALSESPMTDPFERLIAKRKYDSRPYDQISKSFTIILAGVAILFAGGSLAGQVPNIWVLLLRPGLIVALGLLGFKALGSNIGVQRAAIAVYKHRHT